jgi:hypothetical protein
VRNFGGASYADLNARRALVRSVNTAFADLVLRTGTSEMLSVTDRLGISRAAYGGLENPAIALGGLDRGVTPLEMASAYGVYATGGEYAEPFLIERVTDRDGGVLYEVEPQLERVLDPDVSAVMRDVLEEVVGPGRYSSKVHVVPPGVDPDTLRPRGPEEALRGLIEEARRDPKRREVLCECAVLAPEGAHLGRRPGVDLAHGNSLRPQQRARSVLDRFEDLSALPRCRSTRSGPGHRHKRQGDACARQLRRVRGTPTRTVNPGDGTSPSTGAPLSARLPSPEHLSSTKGFHVNGHRTQRQDRRNHRRRFRDRRGQR